MKTPSLDNFQAELKQKLEFRIQIYQKQVKRITEEIHRWVIDDSVDDNFRNFMLHSMIAGRKHFEELLKETNKGRGLLQILRLKIAISIIVNYEF